MSNHSGGVFIPRLSFENDMAIIYLQAGNVLPILQIDSADRPENLKVEFFNQTLVLEGVVIVSQSPIRVGQTLSLVHTGNYNPKKQNVSSTFVPSHVMSKAAVTLEVNSYLTTSDHARTVLADFASNEITFNSNIDLRRGFFGEFQVVQAIGVEVTRGALTNNALELRSSVGVYKHHDVSFIGVPIPAAVPEFLKVQLVCGSNSIELDVPQIGNANEIEHLRISRETRAGERIIYKDPMWPVLERFTYSFDNLNGTQARNLLEFISQSLGQMITLTDHEDIIWSVQLKNPDAEVKQEGHCSYSTELEFEGTRV